jgi:hypothetical protein
MVEPECNDVLAHFLLLTVEPECDVLAHFKLLTVEPECDVLAHF